jgi:hypothetical protein
MGQVFSRGVWRMMRSIERLGRRLSVASVMPLVLLIASTRNPTDPTRKSGGGSVTPTNRYAGVLPVPSSSSKAPNRLDSLLDQHRDARAERGRVLYAAGHAPKAATAPKKIRRQCSDHVASVRGSSSSTPNS